MKGNIINNDIIKLNDNLNPIVESAEALNDAVADALDRESGIRTQQNNLMAEIDILAARMGVLHKIYDQSEPLFSHLDCEFENYYVQQKTVLKKFPEISSIEWIFSSVAGVISVAIDIIFVGTPEVVKIYKGGEIFDGSKITSILREIGTNPDNKTYAVLQWLSDKCKVPYDISAVKNIMYPNNHRIRSLAHDPFLGLFFAIADILLGTTTCIDNSGHLQILTAKNTVSVQEKILSVFYYIGHICSDICTARGIPVPGFFLTQFFTGDGTNDSIAKKAEMMYLDGYDMRHLVSTSVPVMVKNLLIDAYLLISEDEKQTFGIAEKEIREQQISLKREKMLFISDCFATGGNLGKILLPPSCGNPASINLTQWAHLIESSIAMVAGATRDMSVENAVAQRKDIDLNWERLQMDLSEELLYK